MPLYASVTSFLGKTGTREFGNSVDRINGRYSAILLLTLTSLVCLKQFLGRPIECWCPSQFSDSSISYANSICWTKSSYYLPATLTKLPEESHYSEKDYVSKYNYYQWVPLILLLQSLFCRVPHLLWRSFLDQRSANVTGINDAAGMAKNSQLEAREKAMSYMVSLLTRIGYARKVSDSGITCDFSKKRFGFISVGYLFLKVACIITSLLQILLMGSFLEDEARSFMFYGFRSAESIIKGTVLPWPAHLPQVTLCEFELRHQGRVHNYIIQCTLDANYFNEKVFVLLWFWFSILALASSVDLIRWIILVFHSPRAISYVSRRLGFSPEETKEKDAHLLSHFVHVQLGRDGTTILRLIGCSYSDVIAGEALNRLWSSYASEESLPRLDIRSGSL